MNTKLDNQRSIWIASDNLEALNALIEMTKEAEEWASDIEKPQRHRPLVVGMRKAIKERKEVKAIHTIQEIKSNRSIMYPL